MDSIGNTFWNGLASFERQANAAKDARIVKILIVGAILAVIVAVIEAASKKNS